MASSMIHLAVANEINKKLSRNQTKLLIGSIAPDLSKIIGFGKEKSHFLIDLNSSIPNLAMFLEKYASNLNDDFVMGYYIHLYTDYLWFKYFIPEIYDKNLITKLDGTLIKCDENMLSEYIYNDYTNLNIRLIDEYNLNLEIFYRDIPELENIITEIPMNEIKVIIDKVGLIIENTKINKDYVFNLANINQFIKMATELILSDLDKL